MSKIHKKRILTLIISVIFLAVGVPALFGDARVIEGQKGGDPWRNVIFDFQTLLTGLLAVGAACWTVMTMERTDEKSEARHRQLVALSLRSEIIAMERALNPLIEQLKIISEDFNGVIYPLSGVPNETWDWFTGIADTHYHRVVRVDSIVSRPQVVEGAKFFDGPLASAFADIETTTRKLLTDMKTHNNYQVAFAEYRYLEFEHYRTQIWDPNEVSILVNAMRFFGDVETLIEYLERTEREVRALRHRFGTDLA